MHKAKPKRLDPTRRRFLKAIRDLAHEPARAMQAKDAFAQPPIRRTPELRMRRTPGEIATARPRPSSRMTGSPFEGALMAQVETQIVIAETSEARALQEAIFSSVRAYYEYLDRHGRFFDPTIRWVQASALHVRCHMCGTDITLEVAPLDAPLANEAIEPMVA